MDWYARVFDFRVVKEWSGPNGIELAYLAAPGDNGSLIEIIGGGATNDSPPLPADFWAFLGPCRYHHFAFSVPSHKRALETLRERGVKTYEGPFEVPQLGYSVAFVADPWGDLIELVELLDE
jgi:catechol 2,3-dioxygenase-like lactoylglutathione lyase family enzyme